MRFLHLFSAVVAMGSAYAGMAETTGSCAAPFTVPAQAGMSLTIESRSGEIVVTGTDGPGLRVECTLSESDRASEVHIRFEKTGDFGTLSIQGGPSSGNVHIRIEVPRRT